ncbi:DUF3604 domain-containing protein [Altererythrobacter aquaemixtae]|uniref:DUF3604 domain-containing protein n=1 Tax=Pontixanthobacter aquaemixtae TaxID=1958940 RepID=A0A844ZS36_9SPHN|nr:DUF3604 domain-containing protein [Pontixanthobacter aquaemixtae]
MFCTASLALLTYGVAVAVPLGKAQTGEPASLLPKAAGERQYSPPLRAPRTNNVYFGDLHLHTNISTDAYLQGTVATSQADAYRFAMGQTVQTDSGMPARLKRPLDFLAVTDHAENYGLYPGLDAGHPALAGTELEQRWRSVQSIAAEKGLRAAFGSVIRANGPMPELPEKFVRDEWAKSARIADQYNRPGHFTTVIGYEWTGMIKGDNLHRVVLYRDGADQAGKTLPFNAALGNDPEDLWQALESYEASGGQGLAIAHNGNVSNGRMFSPKTVSGQAIDARYAEQRQRWEPVYEATQVKGDGETHPSLSPDDPFADFETWDRYNVAGSTAKEPWMLRYEYARQALIDGLKLEQELGANPFQFGMIGGSDSHTGLATTAEDNFFGKFANGGPSPDRMRDKSAGQPQNNWQLGASGLTAIWAPENTREALFDALKRREVYATTGTRIRLRFFGGWDFTKEELNYADYARIGYERGVPMGSELADGGSGESPVFFLHAIKDPDAANLDRIQIVKGWIDNSGTPREKLFDVALSDSRKPDKNGGIEPVGNTVDVANARYSNSIGDPELMTWWRDPEFDPNQPAFYYVRVLEIPTPRWTTYDAAFYNVPIATGAPEFLQERAYSSPIWYRPTGS